jgi:hypothetical protein
MSMEPGLYITKFNTPLDEAGGVIVVQGDAVSGGDSAMFYTGRITSENSTIEVSLRVRQHDQTRMSVFGDYSDFTLTLKGRKKGDAYVFEGRADRAPSLRFSAVLTPAPA